MVAAKYLVLQDILTNVFYKNIFSPEHWNSCSKIYITIFTYSINEMPINDTSDEIMVWNSLRAAGRTFMKWVGEI